MPVIGQQATQMQRLSSGISWQLPYVSPQGHLITTKLSARGDGYYTRHYETYLSPTPDPSVGQTATRLFSQGSVDWRYPLITNLHNTSWLLQPMATIVASPINSSTKKTPNEDSTIFELDDVNLFQPNRFNGIDRTDSGYRIVYGFDNGFVFPQQRSIALFIGQSRRLDRRQVVPNGLGEDNKQSDYISRLKIRPLSWLVARYRVAVRPNERQLRYSELGIGIGEKTLRLDLGHVYLNKTATIKNQNLSQVNWQLSSQMIDNWSLSFAQIKNLNKTSGGSSLASFVLASYKDECFQLDAGIYKTAYRDRDIHPDSGFLLQLVFKNLGSFVPMTAPKYPGSMLTAF
jgi:LPS-assembly protein